MRRLWTLLFSISLAIGVQAQDILLSAPVSLDVGTGYARLKRDPGVTLTQGPAVMLGLKGGISACYKERVGILMEGGLFLDNYDYGGGGYNYIVSFYAFRLRTGLYVLTNPVNSQGSSLHFGITGGVSFYGNDELIHEEDAFKATSTVQAAQPYFISPEIGFTQFPGSRELDLVLYYTYNFTDRPGLVTTFTTEQGEASGYAYGNSIGLRLRYHLRLMTPPPKGPKLRAPEPSPELLARNTRLNKELRLRSKKVNLIIRDNADEDGDEISIALNNKIVLDHYTIVKKKKKLKLYLDNGANHLLVFAHNEGTVPPNTAEVILRSGWKKHRLIVSSGLDRNEEVRLIVE